MHHILLHYTTQHTHTVPRITGRLCGERQVRLKWLIFRSRKRESEKGVQDLHEGATHAAEYRHKPPGKEKRIKLEKKEKWMNKEGR